MLRSNRTARDPRNNSGSCAARSKIGNPDASDRRVETCTRHVANSAPPKVRRASAHAAARREQPTAKAPTVSAKLPVPQKLAPVPTACRAAFSVRLLVVVPASFSCANQACTFCRKQCHATNPVPGRSSRPTIRARSTLLVARPMHHSTHCSSDNPQFPLHPLDRPRTRSRLNAGVDLIVDRHRAARHAARQLRPIRLPPHRRRGEGLETIHGSL